MRNLLLILALLLSPALHAAEKLPAEPDKETFIEYYVYSQGKGDGPWTAQPKPAGLPGTQGEAISIRLGKDSKPIALRIRTSVQDDGDQGTTLVRMDGSTYYGTKNRDLRLESFTLEADGDDAMTFDVWYRVKRTGDKDWSAWVKNGATAGKAGENKSIEAIEMFVAKKK
jgi:hypothetical protein